MDAAKLIELWDRTQFHSDMTMLDTLRIKDFKLVGEFFYQRFRAVCEPFGIDPMWLLELLGVHRAVVSGSAALLMLFPGRFEPNDLDIFVPHNEASGLMMALVSSGRYTYSNRVVYRDDDDYYGTSPTIEQVHWLNQTGTSRSVNVVVVVGRDPLVAVMSFNATHVMNFVTAHGYGCAYPQLTMAELSIDNVNAATHAMDGSGWKDKHRNRGFTIEAAAELLPRILPNGHQCSTESSCPLLLRHTGDAGMMYVPFKGENAKAEHTMHRYYHRVVWKLYGTCGAYLSGRDGNLDRKGFSYGLGSGI